MRAEVGGRARRGVGRGRRGRDAAMDRSGSLKKRPRWKEGWLGKKEGGARLEIRFLLDSPFSFALVLVFHGFFISLLCDWLLVVNHLKTIRFRTVSFQTFI